MELTSLVLDPIAPFHLIVLIGVAVAILLTWLRFVLFFRQSTQRWTTRLGAGLLTTLAGICLIGATFNPVLRSSRNDGEARHLSVVIDTSGSMLRMEGSWDAVRSQVRAFLEASLNALPDPLMEQATASLITFRDQASVFQGGAFPIRQLLRNLDALDPNVALGTGTSLAAGLEAAGAQVAANGGRGEILLVSDGNELSGDAVAAAERLSQRGIAVTVLPVTSPAPELAIQSAYLPARVESGTENSLRFVVFNGGMNAVEAHLSIARNSGLDSSDPGSFDSASQTPPVPVILEQEDYIAQPYPITFTGMGLQYADVILSDPTDRRLHQRRLFTYVNRPLRLLGIGGNFDWANAISPDFAQVDQIRPSDFTEQVKLGDYDAVILGAVSADEFSEAQLERITDAVRLDGMGLLLINGDHAGALEEAATIIHSYAETPLDSLLPVDSTPRPFTPEPPPRHVVIVIDSSGSMDGWRLAKAKQIAEWIIQTHLRPIDLLDVVVFTTTPLHLVDAMPMTPSGRNTAVQRINSISAVGGTDPRSALMLIQNRRMVNCGMIFISDGDFDSDFRNQAAQYRPDCRPAVFTINEFGVSPDIQAILQGMADAVWVNPNFDPATIALPYFENVVRDKFFEFGTFEPFSMLGIGGVEHVITFPNFSMNGAAITYLREHGEMYAIRPLYRDPILAYGEAGAGYVGVFTGAISDNLVSTPEGRQAVQSWIRFVVPYVAQDRYRFGVNDEGDRLTLTIEVQPEVTSESLTNLAAVPEVNSLNVTLMINGRAEEVQMCPQSVSCNHATFTGYIEMERLEQAQRAVLVIQEEGRQALQRPQRVPILIPALSDSSKAVSEESMSYGVNSKLLSSIAQITGGRYNPNTGYEFFRVNISTETLAEYWNWLLIIGMVFYLTAIVVRKVLP